MAVKITNRATSLLASSINASVTSLSVTAATGSRYPSLSGSDWFPLVVVDGSGAYEIMRATARAGDVITVTRAQEGTTALSFAAGARVDMRMTAAAFAQIVTDLTAAGAVSTAMLADLAVTAAKLDADAVTTAKILDANVTTAKIADDAVTFAKIQNINTARLLGRSTALAGNTEEITVGAGLTLAAGSLSAAVVLPRGYIAGCGLSNNISDANNDIDFAEGICRDSSNTVNMTVAAATKQIDANWVAGNTGGMRYSGAGITNTTYHLYSATKADGTEGKYAYPATAGTDPDSSAFIATVIAALQAETGGADYLYARRLGSILRETISAVDKIVPFVQDGEVFTRKAIASDIAATHPGTSAVSRTLSIPLGLRVQAILHAGINANSSGTAPIGLLSDLSVDDEAPSVSTGNISGGVSGNAGTLNECRIMTNRSGQIRSRVSYSEAGNVRLYINTRGWIDARGKDA